MPSLCGLQRNLCGLGIADFSDENHVRILAQNRTQCGCKCESAFLVDGNLICSAEFVFYGIFDRCDVDFTLDDFSEACVKRCRLAASGGACNEEQPLRSAENFPNCLECRFVKIKAVERLCGIVCWEQSQHAFLSVVYGNGTHADVYFLLKIFKGKTPVVRQAAFRDINVGHDFEANQYRFSKPLRKCPVFR